MPKTKLIISLLVYNQLDITKRCIISILGNTITKDFVLIISDNASNKETEDYLRSLKHPNIIYVRNETNLGYIGAHNKIFNSTESVYFCVLNNDLVIKTFGWDARLLAHFNSGGNLAQVGNKQDFGFLNPDGTGKTRGKNNNIDYIGGSCFIVKRDCVEEVGGLFEEKYMEFAFCEDSDLSLRLKSAGFGLFEDTEVNILHMHNWSFKFEKVDVDFKSIEKRNKAFLILRWKKYLETRKFIPMKILIDRQGALGDVFCIEPILRELKNKFPQCQLFVNTQCPQALLNNPYIVECGKNLKTKFEYDLVIDLNLAYEKRPLMHIVDAYAEEAGVILDVDKKIPIYYGLDNKPEKKTEYICVCSEGSWKSRTWNKDLWKAFIQWVKENVNCQIVEVGTDQSQYLGIGENFIGKLPLQQTIKVISKCSMFIGFDGGLAHFAQSVKTPVFLIFGCTCPVYRIHDWSLSKVVWLNQKELECAGCHHLRESPRVFTECNRDKIYCLENITSDRVTKEFLNKKPVVPEGLKIGDFYMKKPQTKEK